LRHRVFRSCLPPRLGNLPVRGHRRRRLLVIRTNSAARPQEHDGDPQRKQLSHWKTNAHQDLLLWAPARLGAGVGLVGPGPWPEPGAAARGFCGTSGFATSFTFTCCPSSIESGGFSTIQSLAFKPVSTSSDVP